MLTDSSRIKLLRELLANRILVIDGAFGTYIQGLNFGPEDFGGPQYEGCNEYVVLTRPEAIRKMHHSFLEVGADLIETATFGAIPYVLGEYSLADQTHRINRRAAELARLEADAFSTPDKPRFVIGSMGPGTKTISVTGGITFDQVADAYEEQALGLIEGGVDVLLAETVQDTVNVKAVLTGIERAIQKTGAPVAVSVQGTIETMGTLLAGQDIEAFYVSLAHRDLLWMGLNCATGPDFMTDHLRTLSEICRFDVSCVPNAGLPDEDGKYNETPEMFASKVARFIDNGWVNLVGGCCGTTPQHIKLLADAVAGKKPRTPSTLRRSVVSGIETLVIDDGTRPVIVGERTNVLGSRKFKRLIGQGKFEEASEIGRAQVRKGAHVLDVCLQDPDRNEMADVTTFLDILVKKIKVPLMIDSTDAAVIEESLKRSQGKAIINSINLEDGEERFKKVVPLARRFGAALVVGCIDEDKQQAQAVTRERKLQVAQRSFKLLTEKYGVEPEDIIFDPLVFPVGTGDKNYIGSGVETIEGIRLIKAGAAELQNRARRLQRVVRAAGGGPRSSQLGDAVPLRAGRARPRDRQLREARTLPVDSGRGAQARRGSHLVARRGSDRGVRGAFPRAQGQGDRRAAPLAAARRAPRALHSGGFQGRPLRGFERGAHGARPARNHQRPVDEGDGRGRAAVQRQSDDRRRGAAIGRSDEGRGRASRTAHDQDRERQQGQNHPRDGQGRRSRHRKKSGRDHSRQQRLQRRQSRHQGAARGVSSRPIASIGPTRSGCRGCWSSRRR